MGVWDRIGNSGPLPLSSAYPLCLKCIAKAVLLFDLRLLFIYNLIFYLFVFIFLCGFAHLNCDIL